MTKLLVSALAALLSFSCSRSGGAGGDLPEGFRVTASHTPFGAIPSVDYALVPLEVTLNMPIDFSDDRDELAYEVRPLNGGELTEVLTGQQWTMTPLSRYEVTVGGGHYDPFTFEIRTGAARSVIDSEIFATQGMRLVHAGELLHSTLDHTRGSLLIGRRAQEPGKFDFQYATLTAGAPTPLGLEVKELLRTPLDAQPPVLSPDGRYAFLWADGGARIYDLEVDALIPGTPGEIQLETLVFARAGLNVAAARDADNTAVAWRWDATGVEILADPENAIGGRIGGQPYPLAMAGDGRSFGHLSASGYPIYYVLDPSITGFTLGASMGPTDSDMYFSADSSVFYERHVPGGGICRGQFSCEFRINGQYVTSGAMGIAVSKEVPGALVAIYQSFNDSVVLRRHNPNGPSGTAIWPGDVTDVEHPWLPLLTFQTKFQVVGEHMLIQDPGNLHILQASTGEEVATVPGVWSIHPRFDGSFLLREAQRDVEFNVLPECPAAGTCRVVEVGADGIPMDPFVYTAGLPFGQRRDRLLKWRCSGTDCDPVVIQEVDSLKLRTIAYKTAVQINEPDPAATVDGPCWLYRDGGANALAEGVYCAY